MRIAVQFMLVGLLISTLACGGKKPAAELVDPKLVDVNLTGEVGTFAEPTVVEKEIGLRAIAMEDSSVVLSVRNESATPLLVQPRNYAVIKGPNKQTDLVEINAGTADIQYFYPETIPAKGRSVFRFSLKPPVDMRGMRVVMRDAERDLLFFVEVE